MKADVPSISSLGPLYKLFRNAICKNPFQYGSRCFLVSIYREGPSQRVTPTLSKLALPMTMSNSFARVMATLKLVDSISESNFQGVARLNLTAFAR